MTRVKGGLLHAKRRRGILKHTKGFRWGRKSKIKLAKVAKMRAGQFAFDSRRKKKGDFRTLWQTRINAGVRKYGLSYSAFMKALKAKGVTINRKMLATLAVEYPAVFKKIVELVSAK